MVEIKKLKIRKQLYKFEAKRRYQYVRHYKIKERAPIEKIREQFSAILGPKRKAGDKKAPLAPVPGPNRFLLIGIVVIVILALSIGALFFYVQGLRGGTTVSTRAIVSPEINIGVVNDGVITAGPRASPANVGYIQLSYSTKAIKNLNLSLTTYGTSVPLQVFVLMSQMDKAQTTSFPEFKGALKKELWQKKISLNEMDLEQVETLPKGSVLIVPSAFVPEEMLGSHTNYSIASLVDRGVVVLYIGYPFDNMITREGSVIQTPSDLKAVMPFKFEDRQQPSPVGISLIGPFYNAEGSGQDYGNFHIYGVVSVVKKGNGAALFIPQSLDSGWREDGTLAAKDVSRIIEESAWVTPDTSSPLAYQLTPQEENATISEYFTLPFDGDRRYVRLDISGTDVNDEPIGELRVVEVRKGARGSLYVQEGVTVVASEITGKDVRMIADLKEPRADRKFLYMSVLKNGMETRDEVPITRDNPVSLQVQTQFDKFISLDSGNYVLSLVDDEGKVYAQSFLKVVFVDIQKKPDIEERKQFHFVFTKQGEPVRLNNVEVTILSDSGQDYGTTTYKGVSDVYVNASNVLGDSRLPYGKYTFLFKIGEVTKKVPVDLVAPENIFFSPPFLITAIVSVLVIGVSFFFRAGERVVYQLDIPDFPPIQKTKIPVRTDTVLNVFDEVDKDYRWKYVPLTVQEVKNGFKKVFFEGRPMFISDYNVEFIMDKLITKKLAYSFLDYYLPTKWETDSGHSGRYLCMFRLLRDIFVTNAVPFSLMGEETNCDTKITLTGQDMFVHIYDKRGDMKKFISNVLSTTKQGLTIVVFKDNDQKEDFRDVLASPSPVSAALKLEAEANAVQLMNVNEFESLIKEMKSI